jgi:hypothetical protein
LPTRRILIDVSYSLPTEFLPYKAPPVNSPSHAVKAKKLCAKSTVDDLLENAPTANLRPVNSVIECDVSPFELPSVAKRKRQVDREMRTFADNKS